MYEDIIQPWEYSTLVEFCHFISNFNCLSVIMEMTGIPRRAYYLEEHHTPYLYITPSKCDLDTRDYLNFPILEKELIDIDRTPNEVSKCEKLYFAIY